ncbi:MAG: HIT domain-containing protein [Candidatus Iainarchaeum archaeon]|uniref:HIT domain-containing protein n=1 Tax=Candidatus Iainarchaeum sp. TaxID=3101447 RepID=A0A7T9DIV6_9ARCH|nr:MAG: HIT domain-containing protein [Candidatus Diapherotrites archaeon]
MIIEIAGIPRSGKSTLAIKLEKNSIIQEEFFDEVPFDRDDHEKYNLWYASKVKEIIEKNLTTNSRFIMQRGAFDRIVFAKSLYDYGLVSLDCLNEHIRLLEKLIPKMNKIIICECSVENSIKRDKSNGGLTGDIKFLNILRNNYLELGKKYHAKIIDATTEIDLNSTPLNCAFCDTPEIQNRKIYENDYAWAFPTNIPITIGHTLVAPKRCVPMFEDLSEEERKAIFDLATKIKKALERTYHAQGFNVAYNENKVAGQTVPHFHLHLVPRKDDDLGVYEYEPRKFIYRPGSRETIPENELRAISEELKTV